MARILMVAYTNYRRDPRVRREAEALVEAGHEVVFLARRQAGEPPRETLAGVQVIKLPGVPNDKTSFTGYLADYLAFFFLVMGHLLLRPARYALVHVNNMPDFLVWAAWPARLLGRPVIHDVHDLMPEIYAEKFGASGRSRLIRALEWQERWAARFATSVLTVEERLKDILAARGVRREKIHVLMNLPDDRIFKPRGAHPDNGDRFIAVYHGTLARRLGLDIALRAVALARERCPGIELRIIGAGEERDRLIALRDTLGLQAQVTFSDGFVPVEKIPTLIADADAGIIPLRRSSGTDIMLPTKLLEYVCTGIPSIVPRTTTVLRYFDDEMVSFFEAEDPASLADALVALAQDPARRRALSDTAMARFGHRYTWARHKRVYTELVARLLGSA